ncbi:uncharacterized protein LOC128337235 [Hemicordylus capensis]|uniref:uncharacterized protein LOC128337235 n=1 Tax=Hemicordylus capensis TaxID=884348 RepID=UPI002302A656|nr:uncharacterized protein LOC128337235 [Hemicordylus capensis]
MRRAVFGVLMPPLPPHDSPLGFDVRWQGLCCPNDVQLSVEQRTANTHTQAGTTRRSLQQQSSLKEARVMFDVTDDEISRDRELLPEDPEKDQTVVEPQETPSSTSSSTSKEEVIVAEFFNDLQDQSAEKETAPPDLSQPSSVEPQEDTVSTVSDACPGPSTSRGALQEDLPQGPDAEASSFQPPGPIFAWSSSSASTEYLRLSATRSFSPSCLSLNPSPSPPHNLHNVQGKLENLMALQNKQVEDRQEDPMSFRAHLQHVVVMKRQLQQLSTRLGELEEMLLVN